MWLRITYFELKNKCPESGGTQQALIISRVPENLHLCPWKIPLTPDFRKIRPRLHTQLSWEGL